jgi:hypothetical protein
VIDGGSPDGPTPNASSGQADHGGGHNRREDEQDRASISSAGTARAGWGAPPAPSTL